LGWGESCQILSAWARLAWIQSIDLAKPMSVLGFSTRM
jgi:hypothetical protein